MNKIGTSFVTVADSKRTFHFPSLFRGGIFRPMESTLPEGAEGLLQTYTEHGGINYLDAVATLPSRSAIDAACEELMSVMFPGFRGEALVDSSDLPEITRSRLKNLQARLKPATKLRRSHCICRCRP